MVSTCVNDWVTNTIPGNDDQFPFPNCSSTCSKILYTQLISTLVYDTYILYVFNATVTRANVSADECGRDF